MADTTTIVLGVPPQVVDLQQKGLIERDFHDALYPNLGFRAEALWEKWEPGQGSEVFMSRPGLLKPRTKPLPAGQDPQPQAVPYEQWVARLQQYADAVDTHMPTSVTSSSDLFLNNVKMLGLQAGQSINRVARNALVKPYLSGNTVLTAVAGSTDTVLQVAALNGFTDVVVPGVNTAPKNVSPANPLSVTLGVPGSSTARVVSVVGTNPLDASDPEGPGTLILSGTVGGSGFAARAPVTSAYASTIIRAGGAASVDGISASDTFVLQLAINAVGKLRRHNVQPHEDGFFHAKISTDGNSQIFADPVWQRLNQSLPDGLAYSQGFVGHTSGITFAMDNETPDYLNSGDRISTGTNAFYSQDIGAETTNESGINIGRIIITGKGAIYEKGLDEGDFVTEAGLNGKIGEFNVINNGLSIMTERIRLTIRSPVDRLQQNVSSAWSITTAYGVPSDATAQTGPQRYKRAIVIEFAS